jgi:DNA-binding beta-propeller fold protein YncE
MTAGRNADCIDLRVATGIDRRLASGIDARLADCIDLRSRELGPGRVGRQSAAHLLLAGLAALRPAAPGPAALLLAVLLLPALLLAGCSDEASDPGPAPASALYVVNSLGETLDRIDLETGSVSLGVLSLGNGPNDIVVGADPPRLWIANSLDNDVWGIDPDQRVPEPVIDIGNRNNPYRLAILDDGRVAVTNWLGGTLALLDPVAGTVDDRRPIGRTPETVLASGNRLYVTAVGYDLPSGRFGAGKVYVLDTAVRGASPIDSTIVPTNPQALLFDQQGRLHVISTGNYGGYEPASQGAVRVLSAASLDSLGAIELGATPGAGILVNEQVYVSAFFGGLMRYDSRTLEVVRGTADPILDAPGLSGLAYDSLRQRLYVAGFEEDLIYVVDTTADTLVTAWPVGDGPIALGLTAR